MDGQEAKTTDSTPLKINSVSANEKCGSTNGTAAAVPVQFGSDASEGETEDKTVNSGETQSRTATEDCGISLRAAVGGEQLVDDDDPQADSAVSAAASSEVRKGEGEGGIPRQHARLDALLSQIPKKAQHGLLMQCDLILTCLHADQTFIALGTNIGVVFLYNRHTHTIQRLKTEAASEVMTCVKLHQGLDHQLAVGTASGTLYIFLLPGFMSVLKNQLQKFDVRSVHRHYVTCLEWSTNGMRLFSGDKTGHVVSTQVDFYQDQCVSSELLVEPPGSEIVQLHYLHRSLLVSTRHRAFLCRLHTTSEIVQIGQQDRKVQGNFGACFVPAMCKPEDAVLYAARPGCRVWLADMEGAVCNTHIFKDSIGSGSLPQISLLQPSAAPSSNNPEPQFGRIHTFGQRQLVTYNATSLFLLEPGLNRVVAGVKRLGGIVDVAVSGDELFVLRRHSTDPVIRLAVLPEQASTHSTDDGSDRQPLPTALPAKAEGEENRTKAFFKKTFLSPFRKLEDLIQEKSQAGKDPQPPPQSLSPVIRPSGGGNGKEEDLPPVVNLQSPELAVRVFGGGPAVNVQSPDSADSALSAFAEESREDEEDASPTPQAVMPAVSSDPAVSSQDSIIFTHQMKPKKQKKKKHKGQGEADRERDGVSDAWGASGRLLRQGTEEEVDQVLRRAEEALSSVDRLLHSDPDPDVKAAGEGQTGTTVSAREAQPLDITLDPTRVEPREEGHPQVVNLDLDVSTSLGPELASRTDSGTDLVSGVSSGLVLAAGIGCGEARLSSQETVFCQHSSSAGHSGVNTPQDHATSEAEDREGVEVAPTTDQAGKETSVGRAVHSDQQLSVVADNNSELSAEARSDVSAVSSDSQSLRQDSEVRVDSPEDPLLAAQRSLDTLTRPRRSVKKEESTEDFYSLFSSPQSPDADSPHPREHRSFSDWEKGAAEAPSTPREAPRSSSGGKEPERCLANTWSEFSTPANVHSLALSSSHVWFSDKSSNLYYSSLGSTKGIVWRKVGEGASQVSVSPAGHIVWRLHRGHVFAGTKITQRRPEGLKWVEAVRDVRHISVDDNSAWLIKTDGEVMMQRGLSRERPCFRSVSVDQGGGLREVVARHGVVWALTDDGQLLARLGITADTPQGQSWIPLTRQSESFQFSSVSVDQDGTGWGLDPAGQIWFTDHVTPLTPLGSGHWWQVPLSEYIVQDPSVLEQLRSLAGRLDYHKLTAALIPRRGGRIVAGEQGVWLCLHALNTLYVCRSCLQGYRWSLAQPSHMSEATSWTQIQASVADLDWGLVWAQQVNGEIYAMQRDSSDASLVVSPALVCLAVNRLAVWGLTAEGELYVRTAISQRCPLGAQWTPLDLSQLADEHLVHLACNSSFLWAVDAEGHVYHRIGASAPRPGQLNPAWLPILSEVIFTKVVIGPADWMVWGVDNRRLTYVRVGISEEMPIGREWVHVPGIQAMDLCVSASGAWALNTNGEILFRHGITQENVSGNYWKKIPGCCIKLSVSGRDQLWGINTSGQLVRCNTRFLFRRQHSSDPLSSQHSEAATTASQDGDWELV